MTAKNEKSMWIVHTWLKINPAKKNAEIMADLEPVFGQSKSQVARELSEEEKQKLENDKPISEFKQTKLEKDALKNWDLFYKRNGTRFFKDRHWTCREFHELTADYIPKVNKMFSYENRSRWTKCKLLLYASCCLWGVEPGVEFLANYAKMPLPYPSRVLTFHGGGHLPLSWYTPPHFLDASMPLVHKVFLI